MQLIRELAGQDGDYQLSDPELDDLSSEIEDFARIRVERMMRQAQSQTQIGGGKQAQK